MRFETVRLMAICNGIKRPRSCLLHFCILILLCCFCIVSFVDMVKDTIEEEQLDNSFEASNRRKLVNIACIILLLNSYVSYLKFVFRVVLGRELLRRIREDKDEELPEN